MDQEKLALKSALNLIKRRWYTTHQITEKLTAKGFEQVVIKKTIDFLIDKKMLDDVRFAKFWIKDRLNFRPKSRYLIDQELIQKGISKDDISLAWQEIQDEEPIDELQIILDLARKKLKSLTHSQTTPPAGGLLTTTDTRRLISFLARKGYSYDKIKKALALIEKDS